MIRGKAVKQTVHLVKITSGEGGGGGGGVIAETEFLYLSPIVTDILMVRQGEG